VDFPAFLGLPAVCSVMPSESVAGAGRGESSAVSNPLQCLSQ